jgi:hypothetical protein
MGHQDTFNSGWPIPGFYWVLRRLFSKEARHTVVWFSKMSGRLTPIIVRMHRQLQQQRKRLDRQTRIDEQTAKEFERYLARLKRNPRSHSGISP